MRSEAAAAGFYESPWDGERYPRLQLLTVADLLGGRGIEYPAKKAGSNVTFPKGPGAKPASRSKGSSEQLFPPAAATG